ncbi:MAG: MFS transporter [Acidobacteria bacterium]|nr:MFS transporter [Acidobacteriota bacterium]
MAQTLSEFGDWAGQIALAILIFDETGSGFYAAASFAVRFLPWLGLGQWVANRSSRYPVRRFLAFSDLVRAAIYLVLVLPIPIPLMLLLAFIAGSFGPAFRVRESALIPEIVNEDDYPRAMSLQHATGQTMLLAGYAIGGLMVSVFGARATLGINAATFLWSAVLVSSMRHLAARKWPKDEPSSVREGFRIVFGDALLTRAVAIPALAGGLAFAVEATVISYVAQELQSGRRFVGILTSVVAASSALIIAVWAMPNDDPGLLRRSAVMCTCGAAAAAAMFALPPTWPTAIAGYAFLGVVFAGGAPANAAANRRTPNAKRAAVIGVMAGMVFGTEGLGALLGGLLSQLGSPRLTNVVVLCVAALISLFGVLRPIKYPDDAVMPEPESTHDDFSG